MSNQNRVYLNCPYSEKDLCKGAGGRWDPEEQNGMYLKEMNQIDLKGGFQRARIESNLSLEL